MQDLSRIANSLDSIAKDSASFDWQDVAANGLVTLIATGLTAAVAFLVLRSESKARRKDGLIDEVRRATDAIERYADAVLSKEDEVFISFRAVIARVELESLGAERDKQVRAVLNNVIELWSRVHSSTEYAERLDGATRVVNLLGGIPRAKNLPGLVTSSAIALNWPLGEVLPGLD